VLAHVPFLRNGDTAVRGWRPEDAAALASLYDDEVRRWDLAPDRLTVEALRERITVRAERELALGSRLRMAICHPDTDTVAGAVDLIADRTDPCSLEIAFFLGPDARGVGAASAAVRLVTDWALGDAGFDRVLLHAHPDNRASQRVALRTGFRAVSAPGPEQRIVFSRAR
jgi:RimJ/RimL family protein N-acetyltransferase